MTAKAVSILGSTGSIGTRALEVADAFPERLSVKALAAGKNLALLAAQANRFRPLLVSVQSPELARALSGRLDYRPEIVSGEEGLRLAATLSEVELVLSAVVGAAGLDPTLAAIEAGKHVALANKESLVMAGPLLMAEAQKRGLRLIPVDSEHSAVFQALGGKGADQVRRVVLTASGGPFRDKSREEMEKVTPAEAVNHPTWPMGAKISVDSATLMNKALEVIEARWLFDLAPEKIEVLIHPQCLVHALVEFADGSALAQLAPPDMRLPIAYALGYPERWESPFPRLNLAAAGPLEFRPVDQKRFPALGLGYAALAQGGTAAAALNGANETAVEAFLQGRLGFTRIAEVAEAVLDRHQPWPLRRVTDALAADGWARGEARVIIESWR